MSVKDTYLWLSYITHALCEWFLCIYVFIIPKKFDIFYVLYITLLIVLKLIFKYECIINYIDKKLLDKNYTLGSDLKNVPYKQYVYKDNLYVILFISSLICLNLALIFMRNKSKLIKTISAICFAMWIYLEYKTYGPLK